MDSVVKILETLNFYGRVNGTLSVLLCNPFRFHKEAVPALRLEFSRSCTVGVLEVLYKNGCKVSKEK